MNNETKDHTCIFVLQVIVFCVIVAQTLFIMNLKEKNRDELSTIEMLLTALSEQQVLNVVQYDRMQLANRLQREASEQVEEDAAALLNEVLSDEEIQIYYEGIPNE